MKTIILTIILSVLITGCATTYTAIAPGTVDYAGLKINTGQAWNLAPTLVTPSAREGCAVWTQDGILLDRIMIIPAVPSGESIFVTTEDSQALPVFKSDMLPNEIEELTESSIVKLFTEGEVAVSTTNLRPHRFGVNDGVLFDILVTVSDGPNYQGVVGAQVVDENLYLIFFLGAQPYYYEKHLDEALVIIKGARV
jgi:hypothetical protein